MNGLLRSEWIKLTSVRSHLVLVIVALAFPLLISGLTMLLSDDGDIGNDALVVVTVGAGVVSALLIGVIGVLAFAQEVSLGTLRVTYAATPRRARVITAKVLVMVVFGIVFAALVLAICLALGLVIASSRDIDQSMLWSVVAVFVALMVLIAVLGLGLGMLVRNTAVAIVILIAWPMIAEGLIGGLLSLVVDDSFKYMPVSGAIGALSSDMSDAEETFGRVGSVLYLTLWVGIVTAFGALVSIRRDA